MNLNSSQPYPSTASIIAEESSGKVNVHPIMLDSPLSNAFVIQMVGNQLPDAYATPKASSSPLEMTATPEVKRTQSTSPSSMDQI
ncbi:hypothetical protein C1H46_036140 [Malus baccata]|uniref:Uncharacterized protein n=1 Tax=Malus baccata TaxID=106549 RepID=A0A540KVQ1_MALBA|nr:hypothetical protein C1H46_036140 [Malus baccata]